MEQTIYIQLTEDIYYQIIIILTQTLPAGLVSLSILPTEINNQLFQQNHNFTPWSVFLTALIIVSGPGTAACSSSDAQGIGISTEDTLSMGASRQLKASVSCITAAISAPTPDCGNPSSTVTNLPVLITLFTIQSLSIGLIVLRFITSHEMPSFANCSAAYNENLTFLEYPTNVTCFPSRMILALPSGNTQSLSSASSLISKCSPYKFQFYRNITTSFDLMAALSSALLSSASQGDTVISPGILEYHEAQHCECWAATAAAGPFNPRNTIPPLSSPALMQCSLAALFMIWSMACMEKFIVMNSTTGVRPIKAAPQPSPVNPASVIGVSQRRSGPCLSMSPFVILYAPLQLATSSPMMNTLGSRVSSQSRALLSAYRTVIFWEKRGVSRLTRFVSIDNYECMIGETAVRLSRHKQKSFM